MSSPVDKEALAAFVDLLDTQPQSLISFERAVQLMTQIGFSCRLACQLETWNQSVRFCAPPSDLAPVEAEIETPLGPQHVTLEQRMSLPAAVESAVQALDRLVHHFIELEAKGDLGLAQRGELVNRAEMMRRTLMDDGVWRLQRSGSFKWPMDRFQLLIGHGECSELVTVYGPFMAVLARASLADETQPAVGVRNVAEAVAKLLTGRTIERGRSIGAGFLAREEGQQLAELLREYLLSLDNP